MKTLVTILKFTFALALKIIAFLLSKDDSEIITTHDNDVQEDDYSGFGGITVDLETGEFIQKM